MRGQILLTCGQMMVGVGVFRCIRIRSKMMKRKVNGCVDCGLPCMEYCVLRDNSWEYICDECGYEEQLYEYDGKQLCAACILNSLEKIND